MCRVVGQIRRAVESGDCYSYEGEKIKEILTSQEKIETSASDGSLLQYFSNSLATAIKEGNKEKIEELRNIFGNTICENKNLDEIIDRFYMILVAFRNSL